MKAVPPEPELRADFWNRGLWQARWLQLARPNSPPGIYACRLRLTLRQPLCLQCLVTADESFELLVNGELCAKGPEPGSQHRWFYDCVTVNLRKGSNLILARVHYEAEASPYGVCGSFPGFLLAGGRGENSVLNTGEAAWEYTRLPGFSWFKQNVPFDGYTGLRQCSAMKHRDPARETGAGSGWKKVTRFIDACSTLPPSGTKYHRLLLSSRCPPLQPINSIPIQVIRVQGSETGISAAEWEQWVNSRHSVTVPPFSSGAILLSLDTYSNGHFRLATEQGLGAVVEIGLAEALFQGNAKMPDKKIRSGDFSEAKFIGYRDRILGGSESTVEFQPCNLRSGRFIELLFSTKSEPLHLRAFHWQPCEVDPGWTLPTVAKGSPFEDLMAPMILTLKRCLVPAPCDCPYYERLSYIGDTRVTNLCFYALDADVAIPRKTIELFGETQQPDGQLFSRAPSRVAQIIPTYSLIYILMLDDHLHWTGEKSFVAEWTGVARRVLEAWLVPGRESSDLVPSFHGWNFVDWCEGWVTGEPPHEGGISTTVQWLVVLACEAMARLEASRGCDSSACYWKTTAAELAATAHQVFWNGFAYKEVSSSPIFTEHAQILATLTESCPLLPNERQTLISRLLDEAWVSGVARCSLYFRFYLLLAMQKNGMAHLVKRHLQPWREVLRKGLLTFPEQPEPSRSDCHAWSATPIFFAKKN
jgi:alpha-L-rhamnosidase